MSHFYHPVTGELVSQVPYKDAKRAGEMREATLRDARPLGLLPSVTTVLQLLDKPMLNRWKVETALEALFSGMAQTKEEAVEQMDRVGSDAADLGTAIHHGIETALKGLSPWTGSIEVRRQVMPVVEGFMRWYGTSGLVCESAEHTVVSRTYGYAGTIDFLGTLNGQPVICDFKTQDFTELKIGAKKDGKNIGPLFHEPEYPLQLAAYELAIGDLRPGTEWELQPSRDRYSILISRQVPGLVAVKKWEERERWDKAWLNLWAAWQDLKNYYPLEASHD